MVVIDSGLGFASCARDPENCVIITYSHSLQTSTLVEVAFGHNNPRFSNPKHHQSSPRSMLSALRGSHHVPIDVHTSARLLSSTPVISNATFTGSTRLENIIVVIQKRAVAAKQRTLQRNHLCRNDHQRAASSSLWGRGHCLAPD
jgi:hypothetical protein